MSRRAPTRPLALAALLVATVAGYWPALSGGFQFDDLRCIVDDPRLRAPGAYLRQHFLQGFTVDGRPVTDLTFVLDYWRAGATPRSFHLTNLAIHLGVVLLVAAFTRATLRRAGRRDGDWLALVVAALFALHPLQTEAVSYVVQRAEALASGFYLAALLLLFASEDAATRRRSAALYTGAVLAFVAGLGSKLVIVTLPAAYLLHAACFGARAARPPGPRLRAAWRRALPLFAIAGLSAWLNLRRFGGQQAVGFEMPALPARAYLLTQLRAVVVYLRLALWPSGLNFDHDFAVSHRLDSATAVALLLLLVAAAAAMALVVWGSRREEGDPSGQAARLVGYGVAWFFLLLAPTSSVVPLADVLVEHRTYLALWGSCLAVAVGVDQGVRALRVTPSRATWARAALPLVACVALLGALRARNQVWSSAEALWADAALKSPGKWRPHANHGLTLHEQGRYAEAEQEARVALWLAGDGPAPFRATLYESLAATLVGQELHAEALAVLEAGLAGEPEHPALLRGAAQALFSLERYQEAAARARRAIAAAPGDAGARSLLGRSLFLLGSKAEGIAWLLQAERLQPETPDRVRDVALGYEDLAGGHEEACRWWDRYDRFPAADHRLAGEHRASTGCVP